MPKIFEEEVQKEMNCLAVIIVISILFLTILFWAKLS